jgi:hypothetical protein
MFQGNGFSRISSAMIGGRTSTGLLQRLALLNYVEASDLVLPTDA